MTDEINYRLFKLLDNNPHLSQREIAAEPGVSLGKANYCLKALLNRGWLKANNFKNSQNEIAYAYLLTPKGIQEKTKVTIRFPKYKMAEFLFIINPKISLLETTDAHCMVMSSIRAMGSVEQYGWP